MKIELDTIYRRIVDHLENGTTDMAADSIEVPAAHFTDADHLARELDTVTQDEVDLPDLPAVESPTHGRDS